MTRKHSQGVAVAKKSKRQVPPTPSGEATAILPERPSKRRVSLTLDADVVVRGKEYGERRGMSLSQLVNDVLRALVAHSSVDDRLGELPPPVERLFDVASAGEADGASHRVHLLEKYGNGS